MTSYLISNYSNLMSYSNLGKIFKIKDNHTVKRYITYLEDSFLIFIVEKFSYKLKTQILSPKKVYIIDMALISKLSLNPENNGRLMENLVAIELLRRVKKRENQINENIYYWENTNGFQIDFIRFYENKVNQLIQVSYIQERSEIPERELENFIKAEKDLKCENFLLITWTFEDIIEKNGNEIICIPLWKWLLT